MRNKLLFGIVFFTLFFVFSSFVSATIYRVGDSRYINRHGVRQWVSSACALDVMIPTGTSGEWTAFRSNSPACVTLQTCNPSEVCCDSSGNIRPNGYVVSTGDYECQSGSGSPNCCVECQTDTICTGASGTSTSTTTGACRNANQGLRCESYSGYSGAPTQNNGCQVRERARTCSSGACTGSYTLRWVNQNEGNICRNWYWTNMYQNNECQRSQRRDRCDSGSCTFSGWTSEDQRWMNVNEGNWCTGWYWVGGTFWGGCARIRERRRCSAGQCDDEIQETVAVNVGEVCRRECTGSGCFMSQSCKEFRCWDGSGGFLGCAVNTYTAITSCWGACSCPGGECSGVSNC